MRCLSVLFALLLPIPATAQGNEDLVSESIYACSRNQSISMTAISRDMGRPWLQVTWIDSQLVTMENKGTMEAPRFEQVNPSEGKGYDWHQRTDEEAELGWTGEDGKRQVVLVCNTSGEGATKVNLLNPAARSSLRQNSLVRFSARPRNCICREKAPGRSC